MLKGDLNWQSYGKVDCADHDNHLPVEEESGVLGDTDLVFLGRSGVQHYVLIFSVLIVNLRSLLVNFHIDAVKCGHYRLRSYLLEHQVLYGVL